MSRVVPVAVAVVSDAAGRILISRRADDAHQGGLWEFPGGKIEPGEPVRQALARELHEELGVQVQCAEPLIRIHHDYGDKEVLLDVWRVTRFEGEPHGREGQAWQWVDSAALAGFEFPAANRPIVAAARLPDRYLITPDPYDEPAFETFLGGLRASLEAGVRLVQLRATNLNQARYRQLAEDALVLCRSFDARLLLNADPALVHELGADGVHLSSARLLDLEARPLSPEMWVAASVHGLGELHHAQRIGVDFGVLSPVQATLSHPGARTLGWSGLRAVSERARLPLYALGGMQAELLNEACAHGAQGIAAIRGLWAGDATPAQARSASG